jgi:hypothetical protein
MTLFLIHNTHTPARHTEPNQIFKALVDARVTSELFIQRIVAPIIRIILVVALELRALAHQTFRFPSRVRVAPEFFLVEKLGFDLPAT